VKWSIEVTPLEKAMIAVGSERAARAAARRLWPDMPAPVVAALVTLIRRTQQEEEEETE